MWQRHVGISDIFSAFTLQKKSQPWRSNLVSGFYLPLSNSQRCSWTQSDWITDAQPAMCSYNRKTRRRRSCWWSGGSQKPCLSAAKGAKVMITRNIWQTEGVISMIFEPILFLPSSDHYFSDWDRSCQCNDWNYWRCHLGSGIVSVWTSSRSARIVQNLQRTYLMAYRTASRLSKWHTHCSNHAFKNNLRN